MTDYTLTAEPTSYEIPTNTATIIIPISGEELEFFLWWSGRRPGWQNREYQQ